MRTSEWVRAVWRPRWLEQADGIAQDLRYAVRSLRRTPRFAFTVVLTLMLGLGVNGALFSILDRVFLRPPTGIPAPGALKRLYYYRPNEPGPFAPSNGVYSVVPYPEYAAIRSGIGGGAPVGAYIEPREVTAEASGAVVTAMRSYASRSYFDVCGVTPRIGRFFNPEEDRVEVNSPVVVISEQFRRRVFGADSTVIGSPIRIGKTTYTIIGVVHGDFAGLDLNRTDVWLPLGDYPTPTVFSEPWYVGYIAVLDVVARTPTRVAADQLRTVATSAYRASREQQGIADSTSKVLVGPIISDLGPADSTAETRISTRLAAVAIIVLLIACGNVANLLLLRASSRRREMAVRRALGVSERRLWRQLVVESLALSSLAAAAASALAMWADRALTGLLFADIHWANAGVSARTVLFIVVASVLTGVGAGVAPILDLSRTNTADVLRSDAHTATSHRAWLRSGLVVFQGTLTVVLLVGAGLFLKSLRNVDTIDLGFRPSGLVTVHPLFYHPERGPGRLAPHLDGVASRLSNFPGVEHVAVASVAPLQGRFAIDLFIAGRDEAVQREHRPPSAILTSPEYAATVGLHAIAGRFFDGGDRTGSERVAVVNRTMAAFAWPGPGGPSGALGQCIFVRRRSAPCIRVVGVTEDAHVSGVLDEPSIQVYLPLEQNPFDDRDLGSPFTERVVLMRTRPGTEHAVMAFARTVTRQAVPDAGDIVITDVSQLVDRDLRPWRLGAALFSAMGMLAVAIAAVGVYAVFSYAVSQRTREMGIRIALGAQLVDVVRMVLDDAVRVVALGAMIGAAVALLLGRLVTSLLYGVTAHDPWVILGGVALLGVLGVASSLVPALRAGRVDPATVLRAD